MPQIRASDVVNSAMTPPGFVVRGIRRAFRANPGREADHARALELDASPRGALPRSFQTQEHQPGDPRRPPIGWRSALAGLRPRGCVHSLIWLVEASPNARSARRARTWIGPWFRLGLAGLAARLGKRAHFICDTFSPGRARGRSVVGG